MKTMKDLAELLKEALQLPPDARAELAGSLLDSLDQEVDDDAEIAWQSEIDRRIKDIDSGKITTVPWSEARRKIFGQ